ncbi:hypothetical protein Trydic_g19250 [Trypoxylus dichotomus]
MNNGLDLTVTPAITAVAAAAAAIRRPRKHNLVPLQNERIIDLRWNEGYLSPYNPAVLTGIIANNGIETSALYHWPVASQRKT